MLDKSLDQILNKTRRIYGLDSMRFFAFLLVFLFHASPYLTMGYLGVDVFFVLSSFLLTYLAMTEIENTGMFSKKNFFFRRALRIFPLYFLVVFVLLIIVPVIADRLAIDISLPSDKYLYWIFLSNYDIGDYIFALKFLWSIAVEEQFYLIFIIASFLFRRNIWFFVAVLLVVYLVFMQFWSNDSGLSLYYHTITHFSNFLIGIAAGYIYFKKSYSSKVIMTVMISAVVWMLIGVDETMFNLLFSTIIASIILLVADHEEMLRKVPFLSLTEWLGVYTYGLYVYSGLVLTFGSKYLAVDNLFLKVFIELILVIVISVVSYHLFEKRMLRLKRYFR